MEEPTKIEVKGTADVEPTAPPVVVDPVQPAGVPEGTELPNEHGTEVVVHDLDEAGNIIGWHKELK